MPRPLEAPRQGLTFSPAVVVAALLTVLIAVFAVFLGVQLIRFAKPPTLAVTDPATAVIDVAEDATAYTLRGTSIPNAHDHRRLRPARTQPYRESADSAGNWQVDVELRRGRNQFDINALDADTGKTADTPARVFITVPFNVVEAPALTVDSAGRGGAVRERRDPGQGLDHEREDRLDLGDPHRAAEGRPGDQPAPSAPAGAPDVGPPPSTSTADGTFDAPLDLAAGKWQIAVTATSRGGQDRRATRNVAITYSGVNLVVEIKGSRAWLKVWVDGKLSDSTGAAGARLRLGQDAHVHRQGLGRGPDGSSGATCFTLNGE